MGNGQQTSKVLELVALHQHDSPVRFAGVDLFESANQPSQHLKLKDAHRLCAEAGVKAHLIPGDLRMALPRVAVTILPSDLVIINQTFEVGCEGYEVLNAWLPRLIHPSSCVFAKQSKSGLMTLLDVQAASQARKVA